MQLIEISVCAEKDVYQIELVGELDASSSIAFDQVLEEASICRPNHVYIDCEKLTYISSAGLGAIISHLQSYQHNNIHLTLCNVQTTVHNTCELVGLNNFITIQTKSA
jgi:anti-sigma B factor antagonist